jgi:hypothetical protein
MPITEVREGAGSIQASRGDALTPFGKEGETSPPSARTDIKYLHLSVLSNISEGYSSIHVLLRMATQCGRSNDILKVFAQEVLNSLDDGRKIGFNRYFVSAFRTTSAES